MARGYPDFFGFSVFPSFGIPTEEDSGFVVIPSGGVPLLIDITGKGRSYGGELFFDGNEDARKVVMPIVTIDGVIFNDFNTDANLQYAWDLSVTRFIRLVCAATQHETASYASYVFGKDFTWGQSFTLALNNVTAAAITARCRFRWAQVR